MATDPAPEVAPNVQSSQALAQGRYVIWRTIASGSQADTFEAVDRQSGRAVAIKRFSVAHAKAWKDVELAEREARVLSSLSHPALPGYLDHFEENGSLYLVMELVPGQDLASFIREGKRLSMDQSLALLKSLSDILEYLHSRVPPVIHRDIKPANIILRPDGSFSLVDFGSVRDGLKPEGGSTVVGTFGYMAPEQFQGRALPASDLYAVGALMLTLLTGLSPERLIHQGLAIDVQASLRGVAPDAWVTALSQLVAIDPERRPSSLKDVLDQLEGKEPEEPGHADEGRESVHPKGTGATADTEPDGSFTVMVGTGFGMLPWILLTVARIVVWLALGVFVPTLLFVLAVFFGPKLRSAAHRVSVAGGLAQARLATIAGHLQRAEPFVLQGKHYRRKPPRYNSWRDSHFGGVTSREAHHRRTRVHVDSPGFHFDTGQADDAETAERLSRHPRRGGAFFAGTDGRFRDANAKKKDGAR